ncbi:MAG: hypothetical protein ACE5LX_08935, partial [Nitrospinota bacterium]
MLRVLSLSALILFTLTTCSQAGKAGFLGWYTKHISGPDLKYLARGKLLVRLKVPQEKRNKGQAKKAQAAEKRNPMSHARESRFLRWYTKYISGPVVRPLARRKLPPPTIMAQAQLGKGKFKAAQAPGREKTASRGWKSSFLRWYSKYISGHGVGPLPRRKLQPLIRVAQAQVGKVDTKKAQASVRKESSMGGWKSSLLHWYTKYISGPELKSLVRQRLLAAHQKVMQAHREKGETRMAQAAEGNKRLPDTNKPLPEKKAIAFIERNPFRYSPPLGGEVAGAKEEPSAPIPKKAPSAILDGRLDALWNRFDRSCQLWRCPIKGKDVIELDRSFRELIREARRSLDPEALSIARQSWVDFRLALGDMRMVQERYLSAATNYCYAFRFARARGMEVEALAKEKFLMAYGEAKGRYRPPKLRHLSGCPRVT